MVNSSLPDGIRVTGQFIGGSTATGLLILVYSLTNDSDLVRYIAIGKDRKLVNSIDVKLNVTGLIGTYYGISVFATENGLPFPRVVSLPKNINIDIQGLYTSRSN